MGICEREGEGMNGPQEWCQRIVKVFMGREEKKAQVVEGYNPCVVSIP